MFQKAIARYVLRNSHKMIDILFYFSSVYLQREALGGLYFAAILG